MSEARRVQISIDGDKCKKDGLCAQVCPARIFRWEEGAIPSVQRAEDCVLCGQCMAICPGDAITHSTLPVDKQRRIEKRRTPNEDVMEFLLQRRSVRVYRDKPVDRALLEQVAQMAGYAPTGAFGGAGWVRRVTIVEGREAMKEVTELTVAYMRKLRSMLDSFMVHAISHVSDEVKGGQLTLPDVKMRLAEWDAGRDAVTYGAPAAVFVSSTKKTPTPHEDCDAALMAMLYASHALGLGACWNGWIGHAAAGDHARFEDLHDLLGLPSDHRVVEAATIGWPKLKLHSVPERRTDLHWFGGS